MERIAILNQKGGVGKTVTAVQMAAWLTGKGKRVLSIDLDPQANLSKTLNGDEDPALTTFDVLTAGTHVAEAAVPTPYGDLIASAHRHKKLSTVDAVLGSNPDKTFLLDDALALCEDAYDYAVIDTPGVRDTLAYNALVAADHIVVPAQGDDYSIDGLAQLADSVRITRRRANPDLKIAGVLLTIFRANTIIARDMASNISEMALALDTSLFKARISQSCIVPEACATQMSVFDYAPGCTVARDYDGFMKELMERIDNDGSK